jgi:hypothetical protein
MRKSLAIAGAAAAMMAGASSAHAASFLTVAANDLCAKSGCFDPSHGYSQTFSASGLSGPVHVGSLRLFKNLLGDLQYSVVKISFQLADGTVVGDWGGFMVAVLGGDVVTLGGQAFNWDPSMGDLVVKLDAVVPGFGRGGARSALFGGSGGSGFGLGSAFGGGASRAAPEAGAAPPAISAAAFDPPGVAAAAAAPEPSTWALAIGGFLGIGVAARHRRRRQLA